MQVRVRKVGDASHLGESNGTRKRASRAEKRLADARRGEGQCRGARLRPSQNLKHLEKLRWAPIDQVTG